MRHRLLPALLLLLLVGAARPAAAALCFFDARFDGTGVPVRWLTMPIKYRINASRLPAAQQAAAIAAVQAAFAAWELPCTTLTFQYDGASTQYGVIDGVINVYWGDDATTWLHGTSTYYWYFGGIKSFASGEMSRAYIGMNARDAQWTVGAAAGKYDIQTAVTHMIPGTMGFFVGTNPVTGALGIPTGQIDHALNGEHQAGARFSYFKAGAGCTQPVQLPPCALWNVVADGGPLPQLDGSVAPDQGAPADGAAPVADQASPATDGAQPATDGAQPTTDGAQPASDRGAASRDRGAGGGDGAALPAGDDSGCCSTSHARSAHQGALLALGVLALLALRRRGRRAR